MRRVLGSGAAAWLVLAMLATVALAVGVTGAEDDFSSGNYTGGSGWTGSWTEVGESTNPNAGVVTVVSSGCSGSCVSIKPIGLGLGLFGISRRADLSGASGAFLTFNYRTDGLLSTERIEVLTRSSSSDNWKSRFLGGSSSWKAGSVVFDDDAGADSEIMFRMSLLSLLSAAFFDDVEITATYPATTSSTTTTSTTTTTTTPASTTTTRPPLITIPSLPIPTTTVPTLPSTTSTTTITVPTLPTTTSTTVASEPTTTTTTAAGTGSGRPPDGGNGDQPRDIDQQTATLPPLSAQELSIARSSNIAIDLATTDDFQTFGVDPLTGLSVGLSSRVEVISTSVLSALAMGGLIAFFAVRQRRDEEEEIPIP